MPILRGSVTFSRYRVDHPGKARPKAPAEVQRWLSRGLKSAAFEPLDRRSEEDRAAGFCELEDRDAAEFAPSHLHYGTRALFAWRVDTLRIPAGQLKDGLAAWAQAFEREQGRKPSRVEKARQKAQLRHELRAKATPSTKLHDVAWELDAGALQIWSATRKVVEEIALALETAFEVRLVPQGPASKAGDPESKSRLLPTLALVGAGLGEAASLEVDDG